VGELNSKVCKPLKIHEYHGTKRIKNPVELARFDIV